jgi:hypothetical protein
MTREGGGEGGGAKHNQRTCFEISKSSPKFKPLMSNISARKTKSRQEGRRRGKKFKTTRKKVENQVRQDWGKIDAM